MTSIFAGDIGAEIELDCGIDVGAATVRELLVLKPDMTEVRWPGTASGATTIKYSTVDGDLSVDGVYYLQAYLEIGGFKGCGEAVPLNVSQRLVS